MIVKRIPAPQDTAKKPLRALIFDSHYDSYKVHAQPIIRKHLSALFVQCCKLPGRHIDENRGVAPHCMLCRKNVSGILKRHH